MIPENRWGKMGQSKNTSGDWIGSLISELDLAEEKGPVADISTFRTQVNDFRLPERIRHTVIEVNEKLGYQALYLLDFLQPQRTVLRLSFTKKKTEYIMEIVLRTSGPAIVLYSMTKAPGPWERYLYGYTRYLGSRIAFNQHFDPPAITDEIMKIWFSFLLSGFNKKFNPGSYLESSEIPDNQIDELLIKASA